MQFCAETTLTFAQCLLILIPPFCSRRMLMGTNDRAIDVMFLPISFASSITLLLKSFQHALPDSRFHPSIKATCDGTPGAVVGYNIACTKARMSGWTTFVEAERSGWKRVSI